MDFAKKYSVIIAGLIITAILFFYLGNQYGREEAKILSAQSQLANTKEGMPEKVDFAPFWKAWSILNEDYVPTSTTTKIATSQDRLWGAIGGMVSSLGDPYTVFFPPVESKKFASEIKGSFGGIGMEVGQENGIITIIAPLKGTPAEAAGLLAGDKIIKVDDHLTANLSVEETVGFMRGPEGTRVTLTIMRQGKAPFDVTIVRQIINVPIIDTKELDGDIFYIALYSFTENSAELFRGALREFIQSGGNKLILDLRGNPGGYLESAIDMASWFLPPGTAVIREDHGEGKDEKVYRSRGYDIFTNRLKMVILVDVGSASASEILAGALSEHGVATLIGQKTFGKGSVQELVPVTADTSIKVTVARWLTPNGHSISGEGITPAIVVKRGEEDIKMSKDAQLDRAVKFLTTGK
ncbi:MAG: S41 family peptidase [Patescibacteria group bacterium]